MDRKKFQQLFIGMDLSMISAIYDDIQLARETGCPIYSNCFYPPNIWSKLIGLHSDIKFYLHGIRKDSEKNMIAISEDEIDEEMLDFPTKIFCIKNRSKFKTLLHKDYLGAIMSLGIKREMMGDLIVKNEYCYGIIKEDLYDLLSKDLLTVGNNPVEITSVSRDEVPVAEFKEKTESVASMRLDLIVSILGNLSRNSAVEKIDCGEVSVNYAVITEKSHIISPGDTVTIRKKGKFIIDKILGESRKGKIRVSFRIYV